MTIKTKLPLAIRWTLFFTVLILAVTFALMFVFPSSLAEVPSILLLVLVPVSPAIALVVSYYLLGKKATYLLLLCALLTSFIPASSYFSGSFQNVYFRIGVLLCLALLIVVYACLTRKWRIRKAAVAYACYAVLLSSFAIILFLALAFVVFPPVYSSVYPGFGLGCIAASGFYCQHPMYYHSNGTVAATIEQYTGVDWTSWAIMFAPQGTMIYNGLPFNITWFAQPSPLRSGQMANDLVLASLGAKNVNDITSGSIWVCYQIGGGTLVADATNCTAGNASHLYYAQIATFTEKAS